MTVENPEGFTEEEQQALDAMQADDGLEVEDVVAEEPEIEEAQESEDVEPVVLEEPKEEPPVEAKADDTRPPEGYVPHGALHAEREKRKALEDRLAKLEEAGKPKEEVPQPADPVLDPEGFRRWQEHQLAQPTQAIERFQQQQQEQARHQQMMQDVTTHEAKFRESNPDYDEAAQFMLQARVSELRGAGYGEPEIQKQVQQDITQLYTAATAAGLNPAQLAYLRAGEMGYKSSASSGRCNPEA